MNEKTKFNSKPMDVTLSIYYTEKTAAAYLGFNNGIGKLIDAEYIQATLDHGRLIIQPGTKANGYKFNREKHRVLITSWTIVEELHNSGMAGYYPLRFQETDGKAQVFYIDRNDRITKQQVDVTLGVYNTKTRAAAELTFNNGIDELIDAEYIQVTVYRGRLIMRPGTKANGYKLNREKHRMRISSHIIVEKLHSSGMAGHYPLKVQETDGKAKAFYIDRNDRLDTQRKKKPVEPVLEITGSAPEALEPKHLTLKAASVASASRADGHNRRALLCFLDMAEAAVDAGDIAKAKQSFMFIREMIDNDII